MAQYARKSKSMHGSISSVVNMGAFYCRPVMCDPFPVLRSIDEDLLPSSGGNDGKHNKSYSIVNWLYQLESAPPVTDGVSASMHILVGNGRPIG